jgi:hypothetical protein
LASFLFEKCLLPALRARRGGRHFRNAFARDAGLRIDHLLLSPSLASRLVRAEVDSGLRGWEKCERPRPDMD